MEAQTHPTESRLVEVGRRDDFAHGDVSIVEVVGREIGIVRWHDEFFALANRCPHMGGPLCAGRVSTLLEGTLEGQLVSNAERPVMVCAWHRWEFGLHDGRSVVNPNVRVPTFPTTIDDAGRVFVQLRPRQAQR